MNNSHIETPVSIPTRDARSFYPINEYYSNRKIINNNGNADLTGVRGQNYIFDSEYSFLPFEHQLLLDDTRLRYQARLQREKDKERRRRLLEQKTYSTIGNIGSTASRELIKSLF